MSSMLAGGFSSFHSTEPVSRIFTKASSSAANSQASSAAERNFGSGL